MLFALAAALLGLVVALAVRTVMDRVSRPRQNAGAAGADSSDNPWMFMGMGNSYSGGAECDDSGSAGGCDGGGDSGGGDGGGGGE